MAQSSIVDPRFKSDLVFNAISREFITLKDDEMREYNVHLKKVLDIFIDRMKKDLMFQACFRRIAYVGSYYEGLKVGKPEEFDLNVVINLPINYNCLTTVIASEKPGYVKIKADADVLPNLRKHVRWTEYNSDLSLIHSGSSTWQSRVGVSGGRRYNPRINGLNTNTEEAESNLKTIRNANSVAMSRAASRRRRRYRKKVMDTWFDEKSHLNQNKFRQWFESVVTRALTSFDNVGGKYVLVASGNKYLLHHKKSGPALTLKIDVPGGHTVDVDLVPVLEFVTPPPKPFINRDTKKKNWFTISKPIDGPSNAILWRPSFYERESDILKGSIKQVIRQMKKLRDTQNFKSIASYYIKTLFLQELEKQKPEFQRSSSTGLFFYMLQQLHEACVNHKIFDFWNPKNNLLSNISSQEMLNIHSRLNKIIKAIDKEIDTDQYVIARYILTKDELQQLKLSMTTNAMYETSLTTNRAPRVQQPAQNPGILTGILNTFWGTSAAAPTSQ